MKQWCLRISAYAPCLLEGLDTIDWSDSIRRLNAPGLAVPKCLYTVPRKDSDIEFTIFTTRADTIFGVIMVLAPESKLVEQQNTRTKADVDTIVGR